MATKRTSAKSTKSKSTAPKKPYETKSRITDLRYDIAHDYQRAPNKRGQLFLRMPPAPTSGRDEPYKPEYRKRKSYIDQQIVLAKARKKKVTTVKRRRP